LASSATALASVFNVEMGAAAAATSLPAALPDPVVFAILVSPWLHAHA
jgi:hypothetical protein